MRNLNTVLFNAELVIQEQSDTKVFAFSTAQNIVRVIAPYGDDYSVFGIFQANNPNEDVAQPSQQLQMIKVGTETVNGETYNVYEREVPAMVAASPRATRIDFVANFYAKTDAELGGVTYRFIGVHYAVENGTIDSQLKTIFTLAETNDYVRVIDNGVSTDYTFDGTNWVDTEDLFAVQVQENRSQLVTWALERGKVGAIPTHKPENTESIISAINLKLDKTEAFDSFFTKQQADARFVEVAGDTMSGNLNMDGNDVLNIEELTGQAALQNTIYTLKGGLEDTDAIKFTMLNELFSLVTDGLQITDLGGASTWQEAFGAALQDKFDLYLKIAEEITDLGDLLDVTINGLADRNGLYYNATSGKWENRLLQVADVPVLPQEKVTDLVTTLNTIQSKIDILEGAYVLRGTINESTQDIENNTALLTSRIDELLERQPQLGDVLKDNEGGEWYFDGGAWRFMGQAYIDLDNYFTKTETNSLLDGKSDVGHTHVEADITNLDKYTQAQVDGFLDGKINVNGDNSNVLDFKFQNQDTDDPLAVGELRLNNNLPEWQISANTLHLLGRQQIERAINRTGAQLAVGTPLFISGVFTPGGGPGTDRIEVDLATRSNANGVFAVASCPSPDNQEGCVILRGTVKGWNTSGFAAGDKLYLTDTAGQYSTTPIGDGGEEYFVGTVVRAAVGGIVLINPTRIADGLFVPNTKLGGSAEGNIPLLDSEGLIAPQFLGERYSDVYVGYGVFDLTDPAVPVLQDLFPPDQWDLGEDEPISEAVAYEQKANTIYITKNVTVNNSYRYSELTSEFVAIQPTPVALGTTAGTAYEGSAGQENRDRIVAIENDYATDTALQAHIVDDTNPHAVTKTQVGLGNVQDFGIADQAEAEAGTADNKYMTPLRTAQAIAELASLGNFLNIDNQDEQRVDKLTLAIIDGKLAYNIEEGE